MSPATLGSFAAVFSYTVWGFFPVFFKQLVSVAPIDLLIWRILICFAVLAVVLLLRFRVAGLIRQVKSVRQWWLLVGSTLMLSINWLVFIYSVESDQVLQSSLGYFLVPIINVALGMLVLKERPNGFKLVAVAIASLGMLATFIVAGFLPWIALTLGVTFGIYGLFRKMADFDSALGLFLETAILMPLALIAALMFIEPITAAAPVTQVWIYLMGVVTIVPLLGMVFAARRIPLSSLAFYQYITPTLHLLFALFIFNEALSTPRLIAFGTTLIAIAFWVAGTVHQYWGRESIEITRSE